MAFAIDSGNSGEIHGLIQGDMKTPKRLAKSAQRRKWLVISITLVIVAGLAGTLWRWSDDSLPNIRITGLDGSTLNLGESTSGPLLVNFWATSCAPCVREMPALVAIQRDFAPRGFKVVAIAMPYDPPSRVLEFQKQYAIPSAMIALDLDGKATAAFSPPAIPYSVLVAPGGRIVKRTLGEVDIDILRSDILRLLEEHR